ncbi:MAG: hypothetical protein RID91_20785 [Azospirillaceae bacterium]
MSLFGLRRHPRDRRSAPPDRRPAAPLDHPSLAAMSPRELADLPLPRPGLRVVEGGAPAPSRDADACVAAEEVA